LRLDPLEERQLFAGLESGGVKVFVFEDPSSIRTPSAETPPAAERVVYVDLNRDGSFQSQEPWAVTDARGQATFDSLSPGRYTVRLLSNQRSVLETTSSQPAGRGEWTLGLGVQRAIDWESDTVGWFVADRSFERWDLANGAALRQIPLPGSVLAEDALSANQWVALLQGEDSTSIVLVNRRTGAVDDITSGLRGIKSFAVIGENVFVLAPKLQDDQSPLGGGEYGVFRLATAPGTSNGPSFQVPTPEIAGLSDQSTFHVVGSRDIVTVEHIGEESRVSSYRHGAGAWQLTAERMFAEHVYFSASLSSPNRFVIDTASGLMVLNNVSGFPVIEVLEQARGGAVFDDSRGILWTRGLDHTGPLIGWSTLDWRRLIDLQMTGSPQVLSGVAAAPPKFSLGFQQDYLIAVVDGHVYRHSLASSAGVSVAVSDGTLEQVALGIRTRGVNRAPTLNELPDFATDEDEPLSIPEDAIAREGADPDGDSLYYFVRSPGAMGRFGWSSDAFAVFQPSPDVHGLDRWTIQAFDGQHWSRSQALRIDIRPVNDLPTGFSGGGIFSVPELEPGAALGRLQVLDADSDAQYRYVVSDGRFLVANGLLSLAPGVALDYEAQATIFVTVHAVEMTQKDSISTELTIHVEDRNDPPVGMILTGNGSVPENRSSYLVGNIGVVDQDRDEVYDITVSDPRFEVRGNEVRVKSGSKVVYQDPGWIELTFTAISRSTGDRLERTERLRIIKDDTPYHNDANPMDVDGDGQVTPLDPLIIINHINNRGTGIIQPGEGELGGDLDVDGDGRVSPLDILIIINELNSRRSGGSQGSSSGSGGGNRPLGEGEGKVSTDLKSPMAPSLFDEELHGRRTRKLSR
jgi:hypothetical protein